MLLNQYKMKNTEYFVSANHSINQVGIAIKDAQTEKDAWVKSNIDLIAKIDREDIIITTWGPNRNNVIVTILLTYYPKQK
jgi:7-cyano-7-deazaguanine synthase in queuosine biosynthesis